MLNLLRCFTSHTDLGGMAKQLCYSTADVQSRKERRRTQGGDTVGRGDCRRKVEWSSDSESRAGDEVKIGEVTKEDVFGRRVGWREGRKRGEERRCEVMG